MVFAVDFVLLAGLIAAVVLPCLGVVGHSGLDGSETEEALAADEFAHMLVPGQDLDDTGESLSLFLLCVCPQLKELDDTDEDTPKTRWPAQQNRYGALGTGAGASPFSAAAQSRQQRLRNGSILSEWQ